MNLKASDWLVRLRPHNATSYAAKSRTVLATSPDGFIFQHKEHGLWVYQTRSLCRYRWLVNGGPPKLSAASNIQEHSWMGYYIANPPNLQDTGRDEKDPAQQTLELQLRRTVGEGMHEDVAVTNYTQVRIKVDLQLEVDGDFADPSEAGKERKQKGNLRPPYAPLRVLMVDPHLPAWLPEITLKNIRVGKATVDLRFFRKDDGNSDYDVLDKRGRLYVVRQPSPWSLTAEFGERLRDTIESMLPGK